MNLKIVIFAFVIFVSSISTFAQTKDEDSLKNLVKQMTDAQTNFQPDTLDKIFTSDYIEISPVGEFDTRDKVLGFYKPELKPPAGKMSATVSADEFSTRNYGKFAVIIVRLNFTMMNDGKPLPPRSIRVTLVCRKEKAAWKIASTQYTGIRPPPTAPKSE